MNAADKALLERLAAEYVPVRELLAENRRVRKELFFRGANLPDVRPEVATFALVMERKLAANDAKKGRQGWKGHDPRALLRRVAEETSEVLDALNARDFGRLAVDDEAILDECADVANMVMMVADAAGVLRG